MSGIKTVIYIDVLLLVNFLIAIVLLLAAGLFCNQSRPFWRLVLGGCTASATTLVLFAPVLPFWMQLCYQAASAMLVVRIGYGNTARRSFWMLVAWYYLFNLLLAGVVSTFLVQSKTTYHGLQTNNLSVYYYISPSLLVGCVIGVYLALKCLIFCFASPHRKMPVQQLRVFLLGQAVAVRAFYDTGFALQDPFSDRVVLLVSFPSVQAQLPPPVCEAIQCMYRGLAPSATAPFALRLLPCSTIAGQCLLPAICAEQLWVQGADVPRTVPLLVAFCQEACFSNGCNALFGTDLATILIQEKEHSHG